MLAILILATNDNESMLVEKNMQILHVHTRAHKAHIVKEVNVGGLPPWIVISHSSSVFSTFLIPCSQILSAQC